MHRKQQLEAMLSALEKVGVFYKNYRTGEATPNWFWYSLGYRPEDMEGYRWLEFVHPEDRTGLRERLEMHETGALDVSESEYRIRNAEGEWRWVRSRGVVVNRDADGPVEFVAVDLDITDRKEAEERATRAKAEAERRAREAEALRVAGSVIAGALEQQEVFDRLLDQAERVMPVSSAVVYAFEDDMLLTVASRGAGVPQLGTRFRPGDDDPRRHALSQPKPVCLVPGGAQYLLWSEEPRQPVFSEKEWWIASPLRVGDTLLGLLTFTTSATADLTERQATARVGVLADFLAVAMDNARRYEATREQAVNDTLTGVSTRHHFQTNARAQLSRSFRADEPVALLMVDVDHFKSVNDEYGHTTGDEALRTIAARLRSCLRSGDLLGRYGGEEFVILLPGADERAALVTAERVRRRIREARVDGVERQVTVSVGCAVVGSAGPSGYELSSLLDFADLAMYEAKSAGRDCVRLSNGVDRRREPGYRE